MEPRKRLADILHQHGDRESLKQAWDRTEAVGDFEPLPGGEYTCRVISGEPFNARQKGTPGYKLAFEVTEGEHADRRVWHDLWLTPQALPMSKRDLAKLGITTLEQLDDPLPSGILAKVRVAVRKDDDGNQFNRIKSFDVIGVEAADAFEPPEETTEGDEPAATNPPKQSTLYEDFRHHPEPRFNNGEPRKERSK
jgi:Protein of unknown function (DUF669)